MRFHCLKYCAQVVDEMQREWLKAVKGIVKSYDQASGKGLIALEGGGGDVRVDFVDSPRIRLAVGLRVEVLRVHGPDAVYASEVRVIP